MLRTAAALIIGNEILTGKIADTNTMFLAKGLFEMGIELRRVLIVPDIISIIASELNALRSSHDIVFTSGGIGPTHDDVTIEAVAQAFQRPIVRSGAVESLIRQHYGDRATDAHFQMANMPEGAETVRSAEVPWPTIVIDNVYLLPGVPEIFEKKFKSLRKRFDHGRQFHSKAVYTMCGECELAQLLAKIAEQMPHVTIGSYIKWNSEDYRTKITFDGNDQAAILKAADLLTSALDPKQIVNR